MSWIGDALSIATTIGKVAGALSDTSTDLVHIGPVGDGGDVGGLIFGITEGRTVAMNPSRTTPVQLFFPAAGLQAVGVGDDGSGANASHSVVIAPLHTYKYAGACFQLYSQADVDAMSITPLQAGPTGTDSAGSAYTVQAQSSQLIAPGLQVALGPHLNLTLNASERVILVAVTGSLTLAGIVLLNIRGAGATAVRIINALRRANGVTDDDDQQITVPLPDGIDVGNGLTFVELIASVGGLDEEIARLEREQPGLTEPMTEADHARVAAFLAARA